MKEWVAKIRETEVAIGEVKSGPAKGEEDQVLWRRSLWAKENIPAGAELTKDMIMIVRPSPAGSLPPNDLYGVLGKRAKTEIKKGDAITFEKLQ